MKMIGRVSRMKLRDKLSHSAIAKANGLSRTAVKKLHNVPGDKAPKHVRKTVEGKLAAFEETRDQSLKADSLLGIAVTMRLRLVHSNRSPPLMTPKNPFVDWSERRSEVML